MSKKDAAEQIINAAGGKDNIISITHCATRLRLKLAAPDIVDQELIRKTPYVLGCLFAGGQFQIVTGNNVTSLFQAIESLLSGAGAQVPRQPAERNGFFSSLFDLISGSFLPILGLLAGAGMLKVLLTMAEKVSLLLPGTTAFTLLASIANAPFYFLPVLLGFSLARKLNINPYVGAAIGAALLEPGYTGLIGQTHQSVLGLPFIPMDYAASVFPICLALFFYYWLDKALKRIVPQALQLFMLPALSLLIIVPLTLLLLGPIALKLSESIAQFFLLLSSSNGLIAGIVLGGIYTFIVLFGLHWGLVPIILTNLAGGGDPIYAMGGMSGFAQMGVALGFLIKSRQSSLRMLAGSSLLPAIFSGVTEPILYGLMLPYRRVFIYAAMGGAIGGGINGYFQVKLVAYAFASFLAIPAFSPAITYLISSLITVLVPALLVIIFGYQKREHQQKETD